MYQQAGANVEDRFKKFTVLVNRIVRNIHKIKTEEMSRLGLKSTHVSCIYYLYRSDKQLTAKELCDICDEDKAAVSRAIEFLEREGYTSCFSKSEKRYRSPIVLTEKGEKLGRFISDKVDELLELSSAGLSEVNRKVFYESLDLISDNLQKICDSQGGK